MSDPAQTTQSVQQPFIIGNWQVDPVRLLLTDVESKKFHEVPPNLMKLLVYLSERPNEVISRDQLMDDVWQGKFVSGESVNRSIAHLRKCLGDSAKQPRFIKTISKQGYQFLQSPTAVGQQTIKQETPQAPKAEAKPKFNMVLASMVVVLFLALGITWALMGQSTTETVFAKMYKQTLSSTRDFNRHPRFSPDGRFIVSEALEKGSSSLVLRDLANDSKRVLFQSSEDLYTLPTFSPSGNEIVYTKSSKGHCELAIYTFKLNQSRKISDCHNIYSANLSWSSDGQWIYASGLKKHNATAGLVAINVDSGDYEEIIFPEQSNSGYLFARISPSNEKFVFIFHDGTTTHSQIGLFDRNSGKVNLLAQQFIQVKQVVWGKNDNEIYFADGAGHRAGIWHMQLDSGKRTFIYNEQILDFDVDPNHQRFIANINNVDLNIWQAQIGNDNQVSRTPLLTSTDSESNPAVSPDGQKLAYVKNRGDKYSLWLLNLEQKRQYPISEFDAGTLSQPVWSPDGSMILLTHFSPGYSTLYVFKTDQPGQVYRKIEQVADAAWHHGNDKLTLIYSNEEKPGVWLYDLDLQSSKSLLNEEVFQINAIKPNSYVVQKTKLGPLYRLDINPNTPKDKQKWQWTPLNIGEHVNLWRMESNILCVTTITPSQHAQLKYFDPVNMSYLSQHIMHNTLMTRYNFSLNKDKNQLFYVSDSNKSMALVMIEPFEK